MRVLITGVNGFVGRHMAALASARGAEVFGCGRSAPGSTAGRAINSAADSVPGSTSGRVAGSIPAATAPPPGLAAYAQVDLRDADATRRVVRELAPDWIVHLAANASVARSWAQPSATIADNVSSTVCLLEAARCEAPAARVLLAGSGEQYGPVPAERLPVGEEESQRPGNPYAASKAAIEILAGFYASTHGLAVSRTRAFNHAGPGQSTDYVVSSFAHQIAAAERSASGRVAILTGNTTPRRDFTDVRDIVRAYWLVLEGGHPGPLNVCSGRSTSIAALLECFGELTELEIEQRTDPERLRKHEVMEIRGSHERLTQATGWQPELPLTRTLGDTLDWWRERLRVEEATR